MYFLPFPLKELFEMFDFFVACSPPQSIVWMFIFVNFAVDIFNAIFHAVFIYVIGLGVMYV